MTSPERSENPPQPTEKTELAAEPTIISQKLEIVDEIENPIERTIKRDALLEQFDELRAEIDTPAIGGGWENPD